MGAALVGGCTGRVVVDVFECIAFREDFVRQATLAIVGIGGDLAELVDRLQFLALCIEVRRMADPVGIHLFRA